jgi:hypothetical protein
MKILFAAALLLAASPAAAQRDNDVVPSGPNVGPGWRGTATQEDRSRLRRWRDAWVAALAQVRAGEHQGEIARGGALFEPDAALADPAPPPGDYDCRTVKLGTPQGDPLDYVAYGAFRCRVRMKRGRLHLTKLTGSQRPVGVLFPDNGRRMVFLGTLMLGDETRALRYGRDRERNLIGVLERVGPNRWRIAFPYPYYESLIDVIELVPRPR